MFSIMIEAMALRVLLVQSDMQIAQPLARYFTQHGDEVWQAWELGQALALIDQVKPTLMLMDLHFASGEWQNFLRRIRHANPDIKVIMTNQYPDLQREMLAREQSVHVFLRQPFTTRWIEQAIKRLNEDTQPMRVRARSQIMHAAPKTDIRQVPQKIRLPIRLKITLPYLLLAVLIALSGSYVVSRVVVEEMQSRFYNRLLETGRQSTDWMVREEDRLLETLRLVSNSQGVAEALTAGDAQVLRALVMPLAANSGEEALILIDASGLSVFAMRLPPEAEPGAYEYARGEPDFQQWPFVSPVLQGARDARGDKFAGLGQAAWKDYFFVSGPVLNTAGQPVGAVLVGKSLHSLSVGIQAETLAETSLYDLQGLLLASTLYNGVEVFPVGEAQVSQVLQRQDISSPTRELHVSSIDYTEILGPWEARGGSDLGVLGISHAQAFLLRTSQTTRWQVFVLVVAAILFVTLVGVYLASLITRPLLRLVTASSEIAKGNLEVKVDVGGDDEVAVLAQSFNYMVAGLQEGSIYRDLLGRTVSPEVREQLRQTFTSGNLRLEGQQSVATVLMCDIRGFTTLSEKADPATIFQWLNEYFGQLVPVVAAHGGVVNKFDGDAMLAFFGILPRPLSPKQSSLAACQTAVEMIEVIDRLNQQRLKRGEPQLITGIGINSGLVSAGGLGTSDRLHYTIIGDTVNTTQRIEGLTRDLMDCSGVLVSQATVNALGGSAARFCLAPAGDYSVKGKKDRIFVYRLTSGVDEEGKNGTPHAD